MIKAIVTILTIISFNVLAVNDTFSCSKNKHFILIDVFTLDQVDFGYMAVDSDGMGAIDIDGDAINDVLHGDFVGRLFETSGIKLKRYGMKHYGSKLIQGALGDLRYLISTGRIEKPAGIIMPIARSIRSLLSARYMNIPDHFNRKTFAKKFREKVREVDGEGSEYAIISQLFLDLESLGSPVYVPAGNNYSQKINVGGLLGAHVVGALTFDGRKDAVYSDASSLTSIRKVGDILSSPVAKGIDINGDQVAEFQWSELSGKKNMVLNRGKQGLPLLSQYDPQYPEFFMKSRDFNKVYGIKEPTLLDRIDKEMGELIHFPSGSYYRSTDNREIVFAPVKTRRHYIQYNYGSSFAIGNLCQ